MNRHRLTAYLLLLLTSIIWGVAGVVIKYTLHGLPPLVFLTYRFGISSAIALAVFVLHRPKLPRKAREIISTVIYGFLSSTVSLGLLFWGLDKTTALTGNMLSAVTPLLVAGAGVLFLHEHITTRERVGIAIAFAGTLFTVLEPVYAAATGTAPISTVEGNLLILASIGVGIITAVQSKLLLRDHTDPATLTHLSFLIGFITLLPLTLLFYPLPTVFHMIVTAPLDIHLGVLFMALLSGTLAYTLWHKAQKMIEISEVAIFSYLLPVWGTPLAVLWLGETITVPFLIGSAIIATGVVIAEYKKHKTKTQSRLRDRHHRLR